LGSSGFSEKIHLMRALPIIISLAVLPCISMADVLSAADREALLENLEKLQDSVNEKVKTRFGSASSDFKAAMASDDAALNLYLACVEKVDFTARDRKPADFRDWKRRESDRLGDAGFKRALRHQLRWLALTLQAGATADREPLASEAQQIVDAIFSQAAELDGQQQVLREAVTATVFARAYDLNTIKIENWPLSPLELGPIYDSILLPPHRKPEKIASLKATWQKRITQETQARTYFSGGGRQERNAAPTPESLRFVNETLPSLQWQMEVDLFRSGDERASAMRMLAHIDKNIAHPRAREWGQQFKELLNPTRPTAAVGGTP